MNQITPNDSFAAKLPSMLRISGAGLLALAAITFMIQSLDFELAFNRILNFSSLIIIVFILSLVCSLIIKEDKSAKISLAVLLGMIPAFILQIAAMIFASTNLVTQSYPKYLAYPGFETNQQIIISTGLLFLFSFLTAYSFRKLVPQISKHILLVFLIGMVAMLIPTRGNTITLISAFLPMLLCLWFEKTRWQNTEQAQTAEAIFSRILAFSPVFIIAIRNISLHNTDRIAFSLLTISLAVFFGLIVSSIKKEYFTFSKTLAIIFAFLSWFLIIEDLDQTIVKDFRYYIVHLPIIFYLLNIRQRFPSTADICLFFANVSFFLMILSQQVINDGVLGTSISLFITVFVISYGWSQQSRLTIINGFLCLLFLLLRYWDLVLEFYKLNPWMFMGIVGVLIILAASYCEKNLDRITHFFNNFKKK